MITGEVSSTEQGKTSRQNRGFSLTSEVILFDKNGMQIKAELLIKSTEAKVKVTLMNVTPVNLTDVSYQVSVPKVTRFSIFYICY